MFLKSSGFLLLHPSGKEPIESARPKEAIFLKVIGRTLLYITPKSDMIHGICKTEGKTFLLEAVVLHGIIKTDPNWSNKCTQWNILSLCHTNLTCNLVGKLNYAWRIIISRNYSADLLSSEPHHLLCLSPRFSAWRHGQQPALIYPPTLL